MVSNYYCQDFDEYINRRFKQKYTKSKAHLNMYYNIIINKHNIGNVYWIDFEKTIYEYMKENTTKFYAFSVVVRYELNDEDISISVDSNEGCIPLYKFPDSGWICYKYCKSRKVRDYIFHRAMLRGIKLDSSSIINNVRITLSSNYKSMTAKHNLQQPRRVLESKLLKHIKNASYDDKINKYHFLTLDFDLLFQ